ncbi:MAG: PadR family transcriptional regulator [Rhizomicrobium sp.]
MDVRTVCLGLLTRGDATGYEIKKQFEDGGYRHFAEASFGSIYPALGRLTDDGLVSVREEPQEKRPDRRVYSITESGRARFLDALMKPPRSDRHRSPFAFAMLFSHLLPESRVRALLDSYIAEKEGVLARIEAGCAKAASAGEQFVNGLGRTIHAAMLDYLRAHRGNLATSIIGVPEQPVAAPLTSDLSMYNTHVRARGPSQAELLAEARRSRRNRKDVPCSATD